MLGDPKLYQKKILERVLLLSELDTGPSLLTLSQWLPLETGCWFRATPLPFQSKS